MRVEEGVSVLEIRLMLPMAMATLLPLAPTPSRSPHNPPFLDLCLYSRYFPTSAYLGDGHGAVQPDAVEERAPLAAVARFGEFGLSCNSRMVLSDKFGLLRLLLRLSLPSVDFFNGRVGEDSFVILRQL